MSPARRLVPVLAAGALFGAGLTVSGMTDPQRVRGFLDLFGQWDPTLAFVMSGAVIVMAIAWRLQRHMGRPLLAEKFVLPARSDLNARLIGGSVLFGIGWGVAGFCPGPVLVGVGMGEVKALIFVAAMLAGMGLFEWLEHRKPAVPATAFSGGDA